MSKIVAFREAIMESLRTNITDLREVEWYDGIFDQDDIADWSLKTPSAFVAIVNGPTEHHSTGEMSVDLKIVVCVVDQDRRRPRDADARIGICETISDLANLNRFGDVNAAPATGVTFKRLSHPGLRQEGVAVGIIEWKSNLTIGTNRVQQREWIYHNGVRVAQTPQNLVGAAKPYSKTVIGLRETLALPVDDEGFTGSSTLDRGVSEKHMVNDQTWEPPQ